MYAVLVLLAALTVPLVDGGVQSIAIEGTLKCGSAPAHEVLVKVVDIDRGGPDDEIDAGYTDYRGHFRLSGDTKEFTTIDPVLKIYHDCNDHGIPCNRKWRIEIPDDYVTKGKNPNATFHVGELNLEVELEGEERDCLH